jgi:hypothetical protein
MTDLRIDVDYAFFCDDVRREDNGKFIFVGVYTQQLSIATFPQLLNLSFFIHGKNMGIGKQPFQIRVLFMPDELSVFGMGATAVIENAPPLGDDAPAFDFFFKGVGIQAQRKGYLSLQFNQHNEGWKELTRLTVVSTGHPSSSGSEQLVSRSPSAAPASSRKRGQRDPSSP